MNRKLTTEQINNIIISGKMTCTCCHTEKELSNFKKRKDIKLLGYNRICMTCRSEMDQIYYLKNKEHIDTCNKNYTSKNIDKIKQQGKLHREKERNLKPKVDKEKLKRESKEKRTQYLKDFYKQNKKIKEYRKKYYQEHKKHLLNWKKEYERKRKATDPLYRLRGSISRLILQGFRHILNTKKCTKTANILCCNFKEFKEYIEKQFDQHMNWSNHGSYWHLDHIKPVSLATTEQELIILNHYTNFQPLEKYENMSKGKKYPYYKNDTQLDNG